MAKRFVLKNVSGPATGTPRILPMVNGKRIRPDEEFEVESLDPFKAYIATGQLSVLLGENKPEPVQEEKAEEPEAETVPDTPQDEAPVEGEDGMSEPSKEEKAKSGEQKAPKAKKRRKRKSSAPSHTAKEAPEADAGDGGTPGLMGAEG